VGVLELQHRHYSVAKLKLFLGTPSRHTEWAHTE
jgi:hypothetical protein